MRHIIVVEPASSGVELVRAAQRRGFTAVVLTGPHGEPDAIDATARAGARVVLVDPHDLASVFDVIARIPMIAAVMAGMEYYVETAATIAQALGLPGIGVDVARRFRDKHRMRRHLAACDIAIPAFALVDETDLLLKKNAEAIATVGVPAVLKPVDGAGSLGVRRIDSATELVEALRAIANERIVDLGQTVGRSWILEAYVVGPEVSLEGVVTQDGCRVVAVTQKILGPEPFFVEMGHVVEAELDAETRRELVAYTEAVVAALGLRLGVFHAEVRLSPDGPRLIEVAARLGGDRIPRLVELATGVSLAHLALRSHLDGPPSPAAFTSMRNRVARKRRSSPRVAGIRFFTTAQITRGSGSTRECESFMSEAAAMVSRFQGVDEVSVEQHACAHHLAMRGGARAARDFRDRVGHIICAAADYATLVARLDESTRTLVDAWRPRNLRSTRNARRTTLLISTLSSTNLEDLRLMKETCLILNRWNDDFARYEHVIDHRSVDVAYITVASHARDIPAGLARHIDVIETPFDHTAVFAATERVQRALRRIDRVIALSEFDLLLAAELRERFSVPGYTASDVLRFRDKIAMKAAVAGKGLRVPRSADLDDDGAVASLVRDVGLPLMVKPRKGAASRGCVRIDDGDMLARERSLRRGHDDEIEMFVDGPILHVDELIENGRLLFARASRYVNTCHAFANGAPLGSVILPPEEAQRPIAFAHACLAALDLHRGAFHLELIYSDQGLVFLEVGARVGGGEIPFVMRDLYGVDLVADWIRLELSHRPQSIGPRANSAELGGFLMLPEPVGQRLIATRSPLGHVAELYAEELPSPGHVFDGNGGYETILGRFRFRGGDRPAIERAIAQTLASYRYHLEAIEQRIA